MQWVQIGPNWSIYAVPSSTDSALHNKLEGMARYAGPKIHE